MEGVLELGGAVKVFLTHHLMWSPQEKESDLGADSSLAMKQSPGKDSAEPWMPTLPAAGGINASVLGWDENLGSAHDRHPTCHVVHT